MCFLLRMRVPIPVIIVVPFIRAPVTSRWGAARSGASPTRERKDKIE